MGSIVNGIFGTGAGASSGGAGGVNDLTSGLQEQSNEALMGLGPTREARQAQVQQFTQALADQAAGKGPSLADAQLRSAMDRSLAQQMAAAKSNRAVNPALAQRQIQRAAGEQQAQTAQNAAMARIQEQNAARGQFANFLGQQQQLAMQARAAALGGAGAAANIDAANAARGDKYLGALIQAGSSAGAKAATGGAMYKGGLVKNYADGGLIENPYVNAMQKAGSAMVDPNDGQIVDIAGGKVPQQTNSLNDAGASFGSALASHFAKPVQPMASTAGKGPGTALMFKEGGMIPGKAPVKGDSIKNDIVPIIASPDEMIVPRTVVEKGPEAIKKFAEQVLAQHEAKKMNKGGMVESQGGGYAAVLAAKKQNGKK